MAFFQNLFRPHSVPSRMNQPQRTAVDGSHIAMDCLLGDALVARRSPNIAHASAWQGTRASGSSCAIGRGISGNSGGGGGECKRRYRAMNCLARGVTHDGHGVVELVDIVALLRTVPSHHVPRCVTQARRSATTVLRSQWPEAVRHSTAVKLTTRRVHAGFCSLLRQLQLCQAELRPPLACTSERAAPVAGWRLPQSHRSTPCCFICSGLPDPAQQ